MATLRSFKKKSLLLFFCFFSLYSITYASTLDCSTAVNISVPVNECQALLDLYDNTNGTSWNNNTNRDTDTDVATRYGVSTNGLNVTSISLSNNSLSGSLPASLSGLVEMQTFYIDGNQVGGSLPSSISTRTNIFEFNISGNQFIGDLPSSRGVRPNIYFINLSHNQFTGTFPSSRGGRSNMGYFYANNNNIGGSLPSSRSTWTTMRTLNIADNQLVGSLPSTRSTWTFLHYLYAQNNKLSGLIPSSRSTFTAMFDFDISSNLLSGSIPSSWYPARPDRGLVYIQYDDNCMQNTGYSAGMQSWLTVNALRTPQNDCTVNPPTILLPTSGQVLTTGNVVVNGTGEAGNIITITISGTTLTGTISSSGFRTISFNNMTDGSYTISAFQTDSVSTYNSSTVIRNFSIAIPSTTPTPSPTPSYGGGGGGTSLQKDNCPSGDNSASYYDRDCGDIISPEVTDTITTIIKQCQYSDGAFEAYKTSMTDIKGKSYEQAVITLLNHCLIHGEANKGTAYKGEDALRYGALYKIVYRLVGKPVEIPAIQNHWSDIYYREGKKLGLREGISIPEDPNRMVGGRAIQKVIHNVLNYRSLNNPALETKLKSKTYGSLLIKRGTFALVIAELINYSK